MPSPQSAWRESRTRFAVTQRKKRERHNYYYRPVVVNMGQLLTLNSAFDSVVWWSAFFLGGDLLEPHDGIPRVARTRVGT